MAKQRLNDGTPSARKLAANRANAKKSTGPITAAGKAASSANALRHGLTAARVVLDFENAAEFEQLKSALVGEFKPATPLEEELVERLAGIAWRLRRVPLFEAALMSWIIYFQAKRHDRVMITLGSTQFSDDDRALVGQTSSQSMVPARRLGRSLEAVMSKHDLLTRLSRYEAQLMVQLEKTLKRLEAAYMMRKPPT